MYVLTEIPIKPRSEIRGRVAKLLAAADPTSTDEFTIPDEEMLALLRLTIRLVIGVAPGSSHCNRRGISVSFLDSDIIKHTASAKAILNFSGIVAGQPISFNDYMQFLDMFQKRRDHSVEWCFDLEVLLMWRALFSTPEDDDAISSDRNPPSSITQAIQFLFPFKDNSRDEQEFSRSRLQYPSASSSSGEIRAALNAGYNGKLVIVSRTALPEPRATENNRANEFGMIAIVTSSSLWQADSEGGRSDFLVDDEHYLLELAPQPRTLWSRAKRTKYVDLVDMSNEDSTTFGVASGGTGSQTGLGMDFSVGIATLLSSPQNRQVDGYM